MIVPTESRESEAPFARSAADSVRELEEVRVDALPLEPWVSCDEFVSRRVGRLRGSGRLSASADGRVVTVMDPEVLGGLQYI